MPNHFDQVKAAYEQIDQEISRNPNAATPALLQRRTELVKEYQNRTNTINFNQLGNFSIAPDPGYNQFRRGGDGTPYTNFVTGLAKDTANYWRRYGLEGGVQNALSAADSQFNFSDLKGNNYNFNYSPPSLDFDQQLQLTQAGQSGFEALADSTKYAADLDFRIAQEGIKAQQDMLKLAGEWEPTTAQKWFGGSNPYTGAELTGYAEMGLEIGGAIFDIWGSMEAREEAERANKANERLQEQQIAAGIITGAQALGAQEAYRANRVGENRAEQDAARAAGAERYTAAFESLGNRYV